jgi:hypothetical protein
MHLGIAHLRRLFVTRCAAIVAQVQDRKYAPLMLVLVWLIVGCDIPERPETITISNVSSFKPARPNEVQDIQQAMAAIITVCRDDLGLPVVDPLLLNLYKNTRSFAFYGSGWSTLPVDVAHFAASAKENKIHINQEKLQNESWGTALPLLAHEYAHNVQYVLTDGSPRGTTWFAEGFAEWVAAKVIDRLGWQDYGITAGRVRRELVRHREIIAGLSWLQNKQDWESLLQKPKGYVRTYGLAFAAVDRLIERRGLISALEYMKSGDFEGSFGESQVAYKVELGISGPTAEREEEQERNIAIYKPEWRVGYRWIYQERRPGMTRTVLKKVVKEDSIRGMPVFRVQGDNEEELYVKDTLGLIATEKGGKLDSQSKRSGVKSFVDS